MDIQRASALGAATNSRSSTGSAINKNSNDLAKIIGKLAIGKRVSKASDDAAALAVGEQLNSQIRGLSMASRNVSDASSALAISDGAAEQITALVQRQRELAIQARNDTLNDKQRLELDVEYQQLNQEIDRISQSTQFNTQSLTNGNGLGRGNANIQIGVTAQDTMNLPTIDFTTRNLGIDTQSIADASKAQKALEASDSALQTISIQRSTIGAMMNRLDSAANNLSVAENNTQAAESVLIDQDMAMGVAEMVKQQFLQETSTRAFARYNEISLNRIQGLLQ